MKENLAPMTFNMPRDWHFQFKAAAASLGISMKDLLVQSFDAWKASNDWTAFELTNEGSESSSHSDAE